MFFFPRHSFMQPPQLSGSLLVSTQAPPHFERPASHATPHWLSVQVALPPITVEQLSPHCPQFATSLFASTHFSPQRSNPPAHTNEQLPPLQLGDALVGAVQTFPHAPQFEVSVESSTHEPLQAVFAPHSVAHFPDWHT